MSSFQLTTCVGLFLNPGDLGVKLRFFTPKVSHMYCLMQGCCWVIFALFWHLSAEYLTIIP